MSFDPGLLTGAGVLAAVSEAGNFARAAEMMGLTPSGVSRAVARLEARVGVRLIDRGPRIVTLTEEGKRFHAHVIPLLASLEEAASDAAGAAAYVGGRLRVSVDPWFARMVLAPQLSRFMAEYPVLNLDLMTSNYREEMMVGTDVAIRFGPPIASSLISLPSVAPFAARKGAGLRRIRAEDNERRRSESVRMIVAGTWASSHAQSLSRTR